MKKLVGLLVGCMLMSGTAFAGQLNGSASVSSMSSGSIVSGNFGNDASFAIQRSGNTTQAGFATQKQGNTVTATTFGSSVGYTMGYANDGFVKGVQGGSYNATAHISTPSHR